MQPGNPVLGRADAAGQLNSMFYAFKTSIGSFRQVAMPFKAGGKGAD
jgi:hypothetical protein